MTRAPVLLAAMLAFGFDGAVPLAAQRSPVVAVVDATVIDTARGALPHQTILVREARILAVGPAGSVTVPTGAVRIEGRGKYAMPGLWDMHFHMTGWQATAPELLVAYGVTGIRDMGGDWAMLRALRDSIDADLRVGPHLVLPGPLVDGEKPGIPWRYTVHDAAEGAAAVDSLARQGVDFIKVHNAVPRDAYFALMDAARRRHMVVAGHVPKTVTPSEASDAGQRSIEHVATIFEGTFSAAHPSPSDQLRSGSAFVESGADTLADRFVRNHTWFDPTLCPYLLRIHRGVVPADVEPLLRYVSPATRQEWSSFEPDRADTVATVVRGRQIFYDGTARMTGIFARHGVPILAGTDVGGPGMIPGYSLHRELQLLVQDAGLSPLAALAAATLEPARYFGADSLGSIAAGKVADIVLLDANPLDSIVNTLRIDAVVLRGRYLDRPALDRLLSEAARRAAQPTSP